MSMQTLLNERTWPSKDSRYSGYSFAIGKASGAPALGAGGKVFPDEASRDVDTNTRFDLASITKLYTATVAAILASRKELDLEAPIGSWMDVSKDLESLTSIELLTHTSGLPDVWQEQPSRGQTIDSLFSLKPNMEQRGSMVYSCTGYSLFAIGLERKFGKRFDEILQQLVIGPLGLSETGYLPLSHTKNIAVGCEPGEGLEAGIVHDPRSRHLDGVSGNAGLFGTAADLHKFFSEVLTGDAGVVTDAARQILLTPLVADEWEQCVGFRHNDVQMLGKNKHFFSHTGFTGTMAMVDKETKQVAVMLTNRLVCETTREQMADVYLSFSNAVEVGA
jgi:CubicO group peptidase (beta-lactamase class C family)